MSNIVFYKVGGAVRDQLLGVAVTDVDWVVVGADVDYMLAQGYQPVGADFPVFIHPVTGEEYALARTERKSGRGYGGFSFYTSPEVTLEEDLARRDLTINAIAQDQQGNLYDPYNGQQDLKNRILRHVSPAFIEDPLRVLRVARFAARYAQYGFTIAPETLELMRQLSLSGELKDLTAERVWKEFSRALMEANPEVFLEVLAKCSALSSIFPEIQDDLPKLSIALQRAARTNQPLVVRWGCLFIGLATEPTMLSISQINERFKTPNDCNDFACLVTHYLTVCEVALTLCAEELLKILLKVDVIRRPERLAGLLQVCLINAQVIGVIMDEKGIYPPIKFLSELAEVVRKIPVEPFVAKGLVGAEIGKALTAERLLQINKVIRTYREKW